MGGPKISRYYLPKQFPFFSSASWVEFWWCFCRRGPSNVHIWAPWLWCETPAAMTPKRGKKERKWLWPTLAYPILANPCLASPFGRQFGPIHFGPIHVCVVLVFLLFFLRVLLLWLLLVWTLPWTTRRRTAQNFASFPSPAPFRSFSLSWCLLVQFWWCLKRRDPQMYTFGLSG